MPDAKDLRIAELQAQYEQLQGQHQAQLTEQGNRGIVKAAEVADAIAFTLQAARQGHPGAMTGIRTLKQVLTDVQTAGIILPNGPPAA